MDDDSLLCDEKWISSPDVTCSDQYFDDVFPEHYSLDGDDSGTSRHRRLYPTKEESENTLRVWLGKETSYMAPSGFVANVVSKGLVAPRIKAIQWLIKCRSRLGLSYGTVFLAANYFDRFISLCGCQEWKEWMVELLSVACLSVASKFSETFTTSPSLHEIQMQDLQHSFQSSTIQRMELMLTTTLEWQLSSVTPYSYLELLIRDHIEFLQPSLRDQLTTHITELLLLRIHEIKLTEFRPSVVAASAVRNGLEQYTLLTGIHLTANNVSKFIDQDQRENLMKCDELMEEILANPRVYSAEISSSCSSLYINRGPSSPVTVLSSDRSIYEDHIDLSSLFEMRGSRANLMKNYSMAHSRLIDFISQHTKKYESQLESTKKM